MSGWKKFVLSVDARYVILFLLLAYLVLGCTVLGFNRKPEQMALTLLSAAFLELCFCRILEKKWVFPLSALITACGLSILLDYAQSLVLLLIPVLAAIGSKYIFRYDNRHFFNPALFGVVFCLFFSKDLISAAPAYQWYGVTSMAFFLGFFAVTMFMPQIDRWRLVVAFLITFTVQTALRAWIMRHHLPFETLFWGTLSSPSFLLFTFYMITDPATSPKEHKTQVWVGIAIATLDLSFHLFKSYYTFFYAAFCVAAFRFLWLHSQKLRQQSLASLKTRVQHYFPKPLTVMAFGVLVFFVVQMKVPLFAADIETPVNFIKISETKSGISVKMGDLFSRLDPRIQHVAKWLLSIGDSVATADIDGDGLQDLFFTFTLKADTDRCSLYLNLGNFEFRRYSLPEVAGVSECETPEIYGIPAYALFHDINRDQKPDLFIFRAFGPPLVLQNLSSPGKIRFVDITEKLGLRHLFRSTLGAVFLDVNADGRDDLFLANVLPEFLPDYTNPQKQLNLFKLPEAEYSGDRRMFHFMHESWNNATNGGLNDLFLQDEMGSFVQQNRKEWHIEETHWSLAAGSTDFNHDGWPDIYVASDFGPDDLYYNQQGKSFKRIQGNFFGDIGRDTYKGMNVSIGDIDRNGWMDVYVSNVHHALQAEGSLLWKFFPNPENPTQPIIKEGAMFEGALNESRFGWGAQMGDLDNNGWLDIVQTNGMVNDSIDKQFEECPDYWYVNEKIARSPPAYHSYADKWGDIRGMCIYGWEKNRVYVNRGNEAFPRFVDVAEAAGIHYRGNSRGAALVDLNNDGKLDIVFTHQFESPSIYRNVSNLGPDHKFLMLNLIANAQGRCRGSTTGTQVSLLDVGLPLIREQTSSHGFDAQGDSRIHFGLQTSAEKVDMEINWCGRSKENFLSVPLNEIRTIHEGEGTP